MSPPSAAPPLPTLIFAPNTRLEATAAQKRARTARPAPRERIHLSPRRRLHQPEENIPPRPERSVPFLLEGRHEVTPELDIDWTLCPENWNTELQRREVRNSMIKDQLLAGRDVCYRSSGNSLFPRVWSNDCCTYTPVVSATEVRVDDIVFCQVQPGDRFYAHLVKHKYWQYSQSKWIFTISNLQGRENGWCGIEHIYGRLTNVVH